MNDTNLLEATELAKAYKKREVVKSVSLHVARWRNRRPAWPERRRQNHLPMHSRAKLGIGYLPQEASVFRSLTVAQNILAILQLRKDLDKPARNQMLEHLMEEFQIEHLRDSDGISLSGGERRRVEIARALANQPEFILLDEPFAGVDPVSIIDIQSIIRQLAERGIGVLITDHNVRETLGICDRAYVMGDGEVLAEGNPEQILENKIVRKIYLGDNFKL